jgi:RNA polymerase sigma factor (sigma-70 family)
VPPATHWNLGDASGVSEQEPTLGVEGPPLEEPDLIARARGGDSAAFAQLVQQYEELAFRTAFLIARDAAEAEDAAQEAVVKAYYALDRFRPEAAFRPWLLEIVANTARNRRRAAGRRTQLAQRASSAFMITGADPSPEAAALAEEQRRELLAHVNQLHDDDRLAIACRYFLDLSEAETAAAMGCAPGTVKSRLSRAMQRLRQQLQATTNVEVAHG